LALPTAATSVDLTVNYPAITAYDPSAARRPRPEFRASTAELVFIALDAKQRADREVHLLVGQALAGRRRQSDRRRLSHCQIKGEIIADTTQATGYTSASCSSWSPARTT
jgi:hypothetical protein